MKLTPARALLLYAMFCYESMGENTSLFVANKLAYLMQRLGESSFKRLQFKASHYGPYSVQVDHLVLKGLEQMKLTAFEPIGLRYDKISEVGRYIKKELDSKQIDRLKRLITLINGFQSAFSLELLASVDFIRKENPGISREDAIKEIKNWSSRKEHLFKERYITIAYDHLEQYASKFGFYASPLFH